MKRKNKHKEKIIEALSEAQKIAFSPLSFQAISTMLDAGILREIDSSTDGYTKGALLKKLKISDYTLSTLMEVSEKIGLTEKNDGKYKLTTLGQVFLYDDMTRVNFNFVRDVCYIGASKLAESFVTGEAEGLKMFYPESKTIYPHLPNLPEKMKQSWFEFDHYYSDNCFDIIYKIITPANKIFDIGANTGKFELVYLKHNKNADLTLIDLEENIKIIKDNPELSGCKFYATDILDEKSPLPQMSGAVVMSQFLDCFSGEQIKFILQKVFKFSEDDVKIYILEPFTDRQKFKSAEFSLVHTSLYFTCMANGCSKMYSFEEMNTLINESGFVVNEIYDALGAHDYTLLECKKNVR